MKKESGDYERVYVNIVEVLWKEELFKKEVTDAGLFKTEKDKK